jgi:hypothetical protein
MSIGEYPLRHWICIHGDIIILVCMGGERPSNILSNCCLYVWWSLYMYLGVALDKGLNRWEGLVTAVVWLHVQSP